MRSTLEHVLQTVNELPIEELPDLIGELESIKATALRRLMVALPTPPQYDELLDVTEAARRLCVSEDYLYRHHPEYSFARRQGRKVLFSAQGIEKHIRTQRT